MTAAELLTTLRRRGLRLTRHGDALHVGPRTLLTDADRRALTVLTPAILALLATLAELERDGTAARLRDLAEGLTAEEHQRLAAEAAIGDRLAELMVAVLATPRAGVEVLRCPCGGIAWDPEPEGTGERCATCGAWSPIRLGASATR